MSEIFVKMNVDTVRSSGIIAELGPELWATLCVIAAHMDDKGRCYPSQSAIGRILGVSRQTANNYVRRLLAYRIRGHPIMVVEKDRRDDGKFERNVYIISENSGLSMN